MMFRISIVALVIAACSSSQRSFETGIVTCVAEDAIGIEQSIAAGTFEVYLSNHGADFAVCAMRAWSARKSTIVTPTPPAAVR